MDYAGPSDEERKRHVAAIDRVLDAGELLCEEMSGAEDREAAAMRVFEGEVTSWEQVERELIHRQPSAQPEFLLGSSEILSGQLLIEAARAIEGHDAAELRRTLAVFALRKEDFTTSSQSLLRFEKDLLSAPLTQGTAEEVLSNFKDRANRTLDNIVSETQEVIAKGIEQLKPTFERFGDQLKVLSETFASKEAASFFRAGADKIIGGLRRLAEYLSQPWAQEAIDSVKDAFHLDIKSVLRKAFRCDKTKQRIEGLAAGPDRDADAIIKARAELADLASRYVTLLSCSRWTMTAIGAVGGLLVLTGAGGIHAVSATTVAYGIVTVATILIGIEYTGPKMNHLISVL